MWGKNKTNPEILKWYSHNVLLFPRLYWIVCENNDVEKMPVILVQVFRFFNVFFKDGIIREHLTFSWDLICYWMFSYVSF